ncbi:MAG: hypothetical protein JXB17_09875, partial [Bacteroidales bacterium]|nr:hypothetical protein [Bacteroidales bacterium]
MERLQLFVTGVILSLFLFFIPVFGGEITIGTETNQNHLPMNPYFVYSYTQSIYLQEEIGQTGQIVAIKYRYNNYDTWTDDIVVYMGTTDKTTFEGSSDWIPLTSLTEVYSGSFIVNTTDEW